MTSSQRTTRRILLITLGVISIARGLFACTLELSPDEAYYWTWSKQLAAGYYDHPPAIAFLIRLSTFFWGDSELGVRFMALICGAITCWMIFIISERLVGKSDQALWVALMACASPILSVGSVIHTPDSALVCFWSVAIWFALRAFERNRTADWVGLGVAIGLACLSKLTGLVLIFSVALYAMSCKAGRDCLGRAGPAIALGFAAVLFLPTVIWNTQHQGGSLSFQLKHIMGVLSFRPYGFFEFVAAQAGIVSPLLWIGLLSFLLFAWRRNIRFGRSEAYLLWCFSGPLFCFTAILSWFHKTEANWPAVAYIAALPGMTWALTGGTFYLRKRKMWTLIALGTALSLTLVIHLQALWPFLPIQAKLDPTAKLRGWRQMAQQVKQDADEANASIASEGYGLVSLLRFYTGRSVLYEKNAARASQYDLWQAAQPKSTILFLQPKSTPQPPKMCQNAWQPWMLMHDEEHPDTDAKAQDYHWWVCEKNHVQPRPPSS